MEECVLRSQAKGGEEFSLVFMDLDRFKSVNDKNGHLVGSRLLTEVGHMLKKKIGPEHSAFRYGGDEFVVLMPNTGKAEATEMTRLLYETLRNTKFLESEGLSLHLTGSFGLATFPEDGASVHAMLRAADRMMYEVKNSTRDNLAVAGQGLLIRELQS
jgi:diguanylate cyclase (GGDEF)-like protein